VKRAFVVLVILGSLALLARNESQPLRLAEPVFVEIPPGTGARAMAQKLSAAGVLRNPLPFLVLHAARVARPKLKAGEYRFEGELTFRDVYNKIARGEICYHPVSVPEGFNMFDIAAAVERAGLVKAGAFLAEARNPALIADLAPGARSLEGFLFPDTYLFQRRTTAHEKVQTKTGRFRKVYEELAQADPTLRDPTLRDRVLAVTTIASLVEKETGKPEERPIIAGVFRNRLAIKMPLQCDPTVVYAALLEGMYRGTIYASDLRRGSPYNTYVNSGLPPGPIANPGRASLEAAARPAQTAFLFFVADSNGGHVFSRSLAEHNRHVSDYRKKAHVHG
jgi:UPF0755 protein